MSLPQDRVALVTGAARGIGAATVVALAAAGWRVVAVDRCADDPDLPYSLGTRADLDAVVTAAQATAAARAGVALPAAAASPAGLSVQPGATAQPDPGAPAGMGGQLAAAVPAAATVPGAAGVWVVAAEADVRDPDALAAAVGLAEDYWGGLDAAVAAAGVIGGGVPAWQVPAAQEQAVLDIDLGGVLNLARVSVPALLRRLEPRHGRFLAVASAAATRGLPMLAAYCAAKAGVAGYIRALAVELGGTGITANAVSPGSTDTPILAESARLYDLPGAGAFAAQQPLRRLIDPAEVAAVLAFLAGDGASAMTGAIVPVDGGLAL
jgi:SDR family mycofactocin-dependent oxidoreductase